MKRVCLVLATMLIATTAHAQSATIWFFRSAGPANQDAEVHWIAMPTRVIGALKPGEFFGLTVRPGAYSFAYVHAPARGQSIVVAVREDEQAYIEVSPRSIDFAPADRGITAIQAGRSIEFTAQADPALIAGVSRGIDSSSSAVSRATPATNTGRASGDSFARRQDVVDIYEVGAVRRFVFDWLPSYLRLDLENAAGSEIEFTTNINRWVGIAGRIGGYKDLAFDFDDVYIYSWQAGPVFRKQSGRVSVGAHVLAGAMRGEFHVHVGSVSASAGQNGFMGAVGGRADVALLRWLSLRLVNVEYTPVRFGGEWFSAGKVGAGIVFRFGRTF